MRFPIGQRKIGSVQKQNTITLWLPGKSQIIPENVCMLFNDKKTVNNNVYLFNAE